ncbi:MAG: protein-methionine-sulfoxide reductase catalytic subunit MsrP [Betaproteobacteria bacterium]|nr:protein-methionine-sulfoxide reductase catalytic subunit MsrP [Betaproteobacteria bacterium]
MLILRAADIAPSEITPRELYQRRREFIKAGLGLAAATALGGGVLVPRSAPAATPAAEPRRFDGVRKGPFGSDEKPNSFKDITTYNNFYEFGSDKESPAEYAQAMKTRPWTVNLEGLVHKPKTLDIDDILRLAPLEERIYRLRCVEAWSMVIPWVGFPLSALLRQVDPLGTAKYVEFHSHLDPRTMPGVRLPVLDWPYVEGLRLDEAMHPLTLAGVGLYGQALPNQNGAPLRVVVPWKYGFKSGKSIVKIRFTDKMPQTAWMKANPEEYGFYSNVNPNVDHRRWSQAKERRIGEFRKRQTLLFNGYAEQVAGLYTGMDLARNY